MVSPYLERRLRSYREALREIRKRHAAKRARKATERATSRKAGHLRLLTSEPERDDPQRPAKDH